MIASSVNYKYGGYGQLTNNYVRMLKYDFSNNSSSEAAVNQCRASHKCKPFETDARLDKLALGWAQDLYDHHKDNMWGITHGAWSKRFSAVLPNTRGGENIAFAHSIEEAIHLWLGDIFHRWNLLGSYTHAGIANVGFWWVHDFAVLPHSEEKNRNDFSIL